MTDPDWAAEQAREKSLPEGGVEDLKQQLAELKSENATLRAEVHHLRRRDDTVNTAMTRIDEEMRLAAKLQRDFMPRTLPTLGRARFHSLFRPAGYVSGDLYNVARLDEKHVGFYMVDAVGHGMPAALLTMFMHQALQTKEIGEGTYRLLKPSETLDRLNEAMVEQDLSQSTFATAVVGIVNVETGAIMVAGAGHPNPMVIPKQGDPIELPTEGTLLGIFPGEKFPDTAYTLKPGDRLVIYTDGVEVAFPKPSQGDDEVRYDQDRWRSELLAARGCAADEMLVRLSMAIDSQTGSLTPGDDLTMVLLDFLEEVPKAPG